MYLNIFFFLVFASQIIQFDLDNLSVFCVPMMNPIKGQPKFLWILTAPPTKLWLIPTA